MTPRPLMRRLVRGGLILTLVWSMVPSKTLAAPEGTRLVLRPHCEHTQKSMDPGGAIGGGLDDLSTSFLNGITGESNTDECPLFSIRDPLTRETPILKKGDLLDMDLVLVQDDDIPINRVRTWLAYDPDTLEADLLETSTDFPETAPGEKDFFPSEGYIKIDVNTLEGKGKQGKNIVIARIRMRVRETASASSPISFYDASQTLEGHTMVISGRGTDARNILFPELGSLLVRLEGGTEAIAQTGPPSAKPAPPDNPPMIPAASTPQPSPQPSTQPKPPVAGRSDPPLSTTTPFTLLQVQNLGVTTEGTTLFFGWDPLAAADLIGYNVYYASRSGQYIHKRSLDAVATSTVVRDLPMGIKYFFAIRGVNRAQQESAFSHEVAVTIGSPATSTSPLAASLIPKAPPALRTPLKVATLPGQTGSSTWIGGAIIGIALIGTMFAIRKQLLLS